MSARPASSRATAEIAYGTPLDPAVLECIDCGKRHEHRSWGPVPPCLHYGDTTHPRAAWLCVASCEPLERTGPIYR
jgi:hypothetical protein